MKIFLLSLFSLCFAMFLANAQNDFKVTVNNIMETDSVLVIAQKSSESLFKKWIYGSTTPTEAVFSLSEGDWAIKLDANN